MRGGVAGRVEVGERGGERKLRHLARPGVHDRRERAALHQVGLVGERARGVDGGHVRVVHDALVADPGVGRYSGLRQRGDRLPLVRRRFVGDEDLEGLGVGRTGHRTVLGGLPVLPERLVRTVHT